MLYLSSKQKASGGLWRFLFLFRGESALLSQVCVFPCTRFRFAVIFLKPWHCCQDEMKALQRINSLSLLCGYLGFLTTWILDVVYMLLHRGGVRTANLVTQRILRLLSPHFNLAR